ncbi:MULTISPECIES: hypothetical protein [unclassified Variovorax]|uniref:hypothetical protein n=1 Tax=unclassified Variovorax TaxID=663243 RepID=UPI0008B769CC|nr:MULTISPECIES: hypothetical protein [unclassified Variovorax]SEK13933.1 hypothetical protein SAMN05518853_113140 [Variovorax sp. OK202]SFD93132.1 hypothetical protein SAMN05444746_113140 [Variovorax sp. OK212]
MTTPLLRQTRRMRLAAGALCLCLSCGMANAAAQARVVSSTWLPGGKYALVYEFEGAEYMSLAADPPGAWITVPDTMEANAARPAPRPPPAPVVPVVPVVPPADPFPTSQTYVGGFFVDPLSAALRATGLGLLLGDGWPRGTHRINR